MYANRFFTLAVLMSVAMVTALTVREAVVISALEAQRLERSRAADTARWNAMGQYYERLEQSQIQRSRSADAARWNAMIKLYSFMSPATP